MLRMKKNKTEGRFCKMPIGKKITLLYAGIFSVALILTCLFIFTNMWYYYRDNSKRELLETMSRIEDFIEGDGEVTVESINKLIGDRKIEARIVINSGTDIHADTNPGMDPGSTKSKGDKMVFKSYKFMGEKYLYCEKTIEYRGNTYIIQAFRLSESENKILSFLAFVFVGINILGIIGAYLVGVLISKRFLKPVTDITATAEKISISDLNLRIDVPEADDEIRKLALTFNDMIHRLEVSFENQKQFISDASHEFRTPIAVIQGYASLLSRWGKKDPEVLDEAISSIKTETDYMSGMINQLLCLARGERDADKAPKMLFSLNDLIADILKDFDVLDTDTEITFDEKSRFDIFANESSIRQLIQIFIENAIKYGDSEKGKKVAISLYPDPNNDPVIEIADNGIGISQEDLPRIFERFYRGDKSRNKEISGTGLGLSIAKSIVDNHGGKITAESKLGEGTRFRITLPAPKPIQTNQSKDAPE